MTKADLINLISEKASITRVKAETVVNTIFDSMVEALMRDDRIEIRGFGSVADLEMHMANHGIHRCPAPRPIGALRQPVQIQRLCRHFDRTIGMVPGAARAVGINLDAIAFGVGQIDRL